MTASILPDELQKTYSAFSASTIAWISITLILIAAILVYISVPNGAGFFESLHI